MASIIKRKSKYSVVYYVEDENGVKHQKWESFDTNAAARKRKSEIEHQQDTNTFIAPSALTLSDLLDQYISIYGVNTWAPSTYEGHKSLIDNYIRPLIGDRKLDDINPRMMDHFYKQLKTVKAKARPYGVSEAGFVTPRTIREIHKLLRNAFNQATPTSTPTTTLYSPLRQRDCPEDSPSMTGRLSAKSPESPIRIIIPTPITSPSTTTVPPATRLKSRPLTMTSREEATYSMWKSTATPLITRRQSRRS